MKNTKSRKRFDAGANLFRLRQGRADDPIVHCATEEASTTRGDDVNGQKADSVGAGDCFFAPACEIGEQSRAKISCRIETRLRQWGDDRNEHRNRQADAVEMKNRLDMTDLDTDLFQLNFCKT